MPRFFGESNFHSSVHFPEVSTVVRFLVVLVQDSLAEKALLTQLLSAGCNCEDSNNTLLAQQDK